MQSGHRAPVQDGQEHYRYLQWAASNCGQDEMWVSVQIQIQ